MSVPTIRHRDDSGAKRAALAAWNACVAARRAFHAAHTHAEIHAAADLYLRVTLLVCLDHFDNGPSQAGAGL